MHLGILLMFCMAIGGLLAADVPAKKNDESEVLNLDKYELFLAELAQFVPAVTFIGIGYDLLRANPDGGEIDNAGVDPGLKVTSRVLAYTFNDGNTSPSGIPIPDQIEFVPRQSCVQKSQKRMYTGGNSYQNKFSKSVTSTSGISIPGIFQSAFSKSDRFSEVEEGAFNYGKVYYEINENCNYGEARYLLSLAYDAQFPLRNSFVVDSCKLPIAYSAQEYHDLIEKYGTHIVVKVHVGTREVTRYSEDTSDVVKYASTTVGDSISSSTGLTIKGVSLSAGLEMDQEKFTSSGQSEGAFTRQDYHFTLGSETSPEPILVDLFELHRVYHTDFWTLRDEYVQTYTSCTDDWMDNLAQIQANMQNALTDHPQWINSKVPIDPVMRIPITWPEGTYALPGATDGSCPHAAGFLFQKGFLRQYGRPNVQPNPPEASKWPGGILPPHKDNWKHNFCSKTVAVADTYRWGWPQGKYCIFQKGACPAGMVGGGRLFFDYRTSPGWNNKFGELPDRPGYKLAFCCKTDGDHWTPIRLPTEDPFFLLRRGGRCQEVEGMTVRELSFSFRNYNQGTAEGTVPDNDKSGDRMKLIYCYYKPNC
ncbi:uncharacterized protein LOC119729473 [Patiria miniata]|uniref:MACPF domain-containing protein n=1 Tax=Patiria miniata TaxID=46514 RepID=A0A914A2A6_PATMI|nr:uncharacterized protein LOC119729473 [Patiria miniata]